MTVAKHTPGPWEHVATDPNDGWDGFRIVGLGRQHEWGDIASVTGPQSDQSSVSDARLIAAAPDLLNALKAMKRAGLREGSSASEQAGLDIIYEQACAAIAKATTAVEPNSVGTSEASEP